MITYDCYSDYYKCLCSLAYKYSNRSRFTFDELLSEANMAFLHAVDTYIPDKACFHTHLYTTVVGKLRNYINRTKNKESQLPVIVDDDGHELIDYPVHDYKGTSPEQSASFRNLLESLSKEAKEVVETVLNTPLEMVELVRDMTSNRQDKMHLYKSNVMAYFKSKGWGHTLIVNCFSEIKQTFN